MTLMFKVYRDQILTRKSDVPPIKPIFKSHKTNNFIGFDNR